jgi:hypothetical protein
MAWRTVKKEAGSAASDDVPVSRWWHFSGTESVSEHNRPRAVTSPRRAHTEGVAGPLRLLSAAVAVGMTLAGCGTQIGVPGPSASAGSSTTQAQTQRPTKVLLLMEENTEAEDVGGGSTPYLESLVPHAASVTRMEAGYPRVCPSLPGYLILTSGSRHGICDDRGPARHQLDGPNLFAQVADSGREWRVFAQSMEQTCQRDNSANDLYLVRHTGAPYYASERRRCGDWQVPLGDPDAGALRDALDSGLPAFSLVVPDRCHDMHGGGPCTGDRIAEGDRWLASWVPRILDSKDYRDGNLLVILTWDEGSLTSNDIPTLLLHPSLTGTTVEREADHCDTLRTMAQVLGTTPLGCAAKAKPLVTLPTG